MLQLMDVTLNICQFLWVFHKAVFLDHFFLIQINDLNTAIKHRKVHHFGDDTNPLHINDSIKKLNKAVNSDLRNLTNWLNANKISLNVSKTELILFKPKMKKLDFDLKLTLNGKRIQPTKSVKYLGFKINENLTWIDQINDIAIKFNRPNAMLFEVREFVNTKILKSIYCAIFDCHLNYANKG